MMDLHILSDPITDVWKCPKKVFKKNWHFKKWGVYSDPLKLNFKRFKFVIVVNWHRLNLCRHRIVSELKKGV